MAFRDFGDCPAVKPIVLPIRGKKYSFPGPGDISGRTWLRLQEIGGLTMQAAKAKASGEDFGLDAEVLSDLDQDALMAELCGETLQTMIDDGVTGAEIQNVLKTLMASHMFSEAMAELVWNRQGEAMAPKRKARRGKAPAPSPSRGSHATSPAPPEAETEAAEAGETSSEIGTS